MSSSSKDIYFYSLMLLFVMKGRSSYRDISQLALILDQNNFDKLIDHYGGMTITIPTREEFNDAIRALVLYYKIRVEHRRIDLAMKDAGIDKDKAAKVLSYLKDIDEVMSKINPELLAWSI